MSGAEGQTVVIMPSHRLVIARHAWSPVKSFNGLARMIADAVVKNQNECANSGFRDYGFESETQCVSYVGGGGVTPAGPHAPATRPRTP
jgi:hypothetical protein